MEQHSFKIVYSNEDDVYRILDLTDTSIVGVTEMYETDYDREMRIIKHNEIKTKKVLGAKVVGYGIFIYLDEDNMPIKPKSDDDYLRSVLRQMAAFFKETETDKHPDSFKEYYIPKPKRNTTVSDNRPILKSPEVVCPQPIGISENKPKKVRKRIEASDIIVCVIYGLIGLAVLAIVAGAIWLIVKISQLGIIGTIIFILCAIAFIPEALRGR